MIKVKADFVEYTLDFKFEAGTSRGVLTKKRTFFLRLHHVDQPNMIGLGECGPLDKLSIDDLPNLSKVIAATCQKLNDKKLPRDKEEVYSLAKEVVSEQYPALRFAVETALLDLINGGKRIVFDNAFSQGKTPIPINGLIWMGKEDFMLQQIEQKLKDGYSCIKMKIGAIDFDTECKLLGMIRERFSAKDIVLRVDANGAFAPDEALQKLKRLATYDLHSIEQPIKQGQIEQMAALCAVTPVPIALDEELIGVHSILERENLLRQIKPQYIILKPTLVGGLAACEEWIALAEEQQIDWWITSALESNIGLNAVAQFTAQYPIDKPHGLGTGQLYHNNIPAPLSIDKGHLYQKGNWDLSRIL
ncbi:o-succinylbenzoate synthase [Penaeicola halotolerans]|uniref:o-succinylbenzoate synthase n=1 Tax=Penaeicola halotolerans TaxID=2793196 RepID=UPI001CF8266C|nr:o-succinylbenzoate synthase [Penaeicola halotolerans]